MDNLVEAVDIDQVAELLGVTTWTVYNWVRKGLLHPATAGGKLIFDKSVVIEFKQRQPRRGRPRGKKAAPAVTESPVKATVVVNPATVKPKESIPAWMLPKSKPVAGDSDLVEEEI